MSVIQRIDPFTHESVNFVQIDFWYDNVTVMTDALVDGVMYQKIDEVYYRRQSSGALKVDWFGAIGNANSINSVDDTIAFNKAMLYLATTKGGVLELTSARGYYISGTILLPSNVQLNLNRGILKGSGINTIIKTAFLDNTNTLIDNLLQANENSDSIIKDTSIINGKIVKADIGFNFFNFCMGCYIENIEFIDCVQSWVMKRCFYTYFKNIMSIGANVSNRYAYHFVEQNNAIHLDRVSATKEFGFLFDGGTTALSLTACTAEGGAVAMKFKGECLSVSISGTYFEAIKDVFDFSECVVGVFRIEGNYINATDRIIIGPVFPNQLYGRFDETNSILNIGYVQDGFTYRGLMDISQPRNYMRYTIMTQGGFNQLPDNWIVSEVNYVETVGVSKITETTVMGMMKRVYGAIPIVRSGDVGEGYVNTIVDCTHTVIGIPTSFKIKITTKIRYRADVMFLKFLLTINTYSAVKVIYGEIYGNKIVRQDKVDDLTSIIKEELGFSVIEISGFNELSLDYTIRGSIQLVV